ncbi:MAG: hypothetical protein U0V87_15215 [Acidobacteriota bacterium]
MLVIGSEPQRRLVLIGAGRDRSGFIDAAATLELGLDPRIEEREGW